jgi:hypothetical protein
LEDLLVRPSRRVFEAADAALLEVVFLGVPVWDRALPAAALEVRDVLLSRSVLEDFDAAFDPVVFL